MYSKAVSCFTLMYALENLCAEHILNCVRLERLELLIILDF